MAAGVQPRRLAAGRDGSQPAAARGPLPGEGRRAATQSHSFRVRTRASKLTVGLHTERKRAAGSAAYAGCVHLKVARQCQAATFPLSR